MAARKRVHVDVGRGVGGLSDAAEHGRQRGQEQAEVQWFAVEHVFQHQQAVCLGLKVPGAIVRVALLDLAIAVGSNDACPVDDAVEGAKASNCLLDDRSHGGSIRHVGVHVQDLATQVLNPLDRGDSRADGIIGRVAADPLFPGVPIRHAGTPHQHEPGSVSLGQVL